ncbi:MAG TPA: hypothetical protein VE914_08680 [Candidatus Angelobacter sp.]|nr:hypothetical protein [Candidatus Angelobacter sp.]
MTTAPLAIGIVLLPFVAPHEQPSPTTRAADRIDSVYTDIAGAACATIAVDAETGATTRRCPGIAGYSLLVQDDDARMSIVVVAPDGGRHPLEYWQVVTTAFSTLGEKAEWRVKPQSGKPVPIALIVRVYADESSDPNVATPYLAVAKITPQAACVIARIAPGADMNGQARLVADGAAEKPCLEPIGL